MLKGYTQKPGGRENFIKKNSKEQKTTKLVQHSKQKQIKHNKENQQGREIETN